MHDKVLHLIINFIHAGRSANSTGRIEYKYIRTRSRDVHMSCACRAAASSFRWTSTSCSSLELSRCVIRLIFCLARQLAEGSPSPVTVVCDLDQRARQFGEMASRPNFDGMTVDDTEIWLEQQGIPCEFFEKFSGEFNNGIW